MFSATCKLIIFSLCGSWQLLFLPLQRLKLRPDGSFCSTHPSINIPTGPLSYIISYVYIIYIIYLIYCRSGHSFQKISSHKYPFYCTGVALSLKNAALYQKMLSWENPEYMDLFVCKYLYFLQRCNNIWGGGDNWNANSSKVGRNPCSCSSNCFNFYISPKNVTSVYNMFQKQLKIFPGCEQDGK